MLLRTLTESKFHLHSKLDIIRAKTAQISMVPISSHFNQDVSLYIGKNHCLSGTPASSVRISGHLVVRRKFGLDNTQKLMCLLSRLLHLGARKGDYFVDFFQNILQNIKSVPCRSQHKISTGLSVHVLLDFSSTNFKTE